MTLVDVKVALFGEVDVEEDGLEPEGAVRLRPGLRTDPRDTVRGEPKENGDEEEGPVVVVVGASASPSWSKGRDEEPPDLKE